MWRYLLCTSGSTVVMEVLQVVAPVMEVPVLQSVALQCFPIIVPELPNFLVSAKYIRQNTKWCSFKSCKSVPGIVPISFR